MPHILERGVILLAIAALAAFSLSAQDLASIRGSVTDVTGQPLPEAEVIVTSKETRRIPRLTMTNAAGDYAMPGLITGQYEVSANLPGFKLQKKTVNIVEGVPSRVDFILIVAVVGDGVTIPRDEVVLHREEAERILSSLWSFSMQRSGLSQGDRQWRADELRRQVITRKLHALGSDAVPALLLALKDPGVQLRRNAALLLADLAGGLSVEAQPRVPIHEALPDLKLALKDPDEMVRGWAAQAIRYLE